MSCYHPMYMYKTGRKTKNGADELKFCCTNPHTRTGDEKFLRKYYGEALVPIPCGKCIGCSMDRAKEWSVRCVLEAAEHEANSFITLTYDEYHVPSSLKKDHLSNFIKRLRSKHPDVEIRFFGCGEYGSQNGRPHYHAIIFGYDFPDKEYLCNDGVSHIFRSSELESLWKFGMSSIGEVSMESCAYVARYTTKKASNARGDEFLLMSRRPGIAANWFKSHKDLVYLTDTIYGSFGHTHKVRPSRYFDKLAQKEGIDLTEVKAKRTKRANQVSDLLMHLYQMGMYENLNHLSEYLLASKLTNLKRYV